MPMFICNYETKSGKYESLEFAVPAEPAEIEDIINALIPYIKRKDIYVVNEIFEDDSL